MNTSLSKARAGVFLLLIAISLYSLFMISASNNSYAAGQSLFKFSSLIGLSPSANGYDRQAFRSNLADKLISVVDDIDIPNSKTVALGITALDAGEVAQFLSSPRKSKFRSRNLVAGAAGNNGNGNGIIPSDLLLAFNGANGGVNSGLVSQCIQSLQPNPDTEELIIEEVIACIINGGGDGNLLADNGNDPFGNGGNGIDDLNGNGGNGDPNGNNGNGGNGDPNANNGNGGNGEPNGNGDPNGNGSNGDPVVTAAIPEPSTYMLFGLGLIGLVGFSRKKVKARIS